MRENNARNEGGENGVYVQNADCFSEIRETNGRIELYQILRESEKQQKLEKKVDFLTKE